MRLRSGGTTRTAAPAGALTRQARRIILTLLAVVVMVGLVPAPGALAAAGDVDNDGLNDALEDTLATRFFPWLWFDGGEDCTEPASPTNPGTALARVRRHPNDPNKIAVVYTVLFRRDCGVFLGLGGHRGDVEPFSLTLAPNPACPHGYGAFSLKTIAHEGTVVEDIDQRLLGNSCTWGRLAGGSPFEARIYVSENKHGLYASDESCDSAAFFTENCSETHTLNFNVVNVGEDNARRIDELSSVQFPGEFAWSPVPFAGSIPPPPPPFTGLAGDAGLIRNKWIQDRLLAIGVNPPPSPLCAQPAHAWYQTPNTGASINQGQSLLLAAAGVVPNSVVSFHFTRNGNQVAYYQTRWARSNCVVNQEYMFINPSTFPPGRYQVHTLYLEPVFIDGQHSAVTRVAFLMDLDVQTPPPPPPPPPDPCYDGYGNYICPPPDPCPGCLPILS
jgi:hypothetical protein